MSPLPGWTNDPREMRDDLRKHLDNSVHSIGIEAARSASNIHALLTIAVEIRELRELLAALALESKP